jgi:predicted metal-dependent hydrolase
MKNLRIRVMAPGDVRVSAPTRTPQRVVERFVRERIDWIHRAESRVRVPKPMGEEEERAARSRLQLILDELAPVWIERLGLSQRGVRFFIRKMTTRWGSCTPSTARIRLALALGKTEPRLVEYVLVHELTHLFEGGHGPAFQARMDAALPDWRARRKALNRLSPR